VLAKPLIRKDNLALLTPAAGIPMSVARAKNQRTFLTRPTPFGEWQLTAKADLRYWRWERQIVTDAEKRFWPPEKAILIQAQSAVAVCLRELPLT
jgi:hypothetical protein